MYTASLEVIVPLNGVLLRTRSEDSKSWKHSCFRDVDAGLREA